MLLAKNKIEPRTLSRAPHPKSTLKNKFSLPQTSSPAQAAFKDMKLTQSHEINDLHSNEFQFNIIPPVSQGTGSQLITKKLTSPEWILTSHMNSFYGNHDTDTTSQNPETTQEHPETSENIFENTSEQSHKTTSSNTNELMVVNKSQIRRILEMTVSDDKERQMNETCLKNASKINEELEVNSAIFSNFPNESSEKVNQTTFEMTNHKNRSSISHKTKSAIIRPSEHLEKFYQHEMEMFSEYGLKPYEESRLKKIQQLEKMQLLKEQSENIDVNETDENQEYFNRSKCTKTDSEMKKMRKCSAVVQACFKESTFKHPQRKSLSKSKNSLSKGKRQTNPKLGTKKI